MLMLILDQAFERIVGKPCGFDKVKPKDAFMRIGSKGFVGKVCNVQMWSDASGTDFLKDLFANKPYAKPGDILGNPPLKKVGAYKGAKKVVTRRFDKKP